MIYLNICCCKPVKLSARCLQHLPQKPQLCCQQLLPSLFVHIPKFDAVQQSPLDITFQCSPSSTFHALKHIAVTPSI